MPPPERSRKRLGRCADAVAREGAHEEGGIREWAVATAKFSGNDWGVTQRTVFELGHRQNSSQYRDEFTWDVDLVLIAMGFSGPVRTG